MPAIVLGIALGAAPLAAAAPSQGATGSMTARAAVGLAPTLPTGTVSTAAPAASEKLSLDLELNTGHSAELAQYAAGVGEKSSPFYHRYLKPEQVARYFGAGPTEVAAVQSSLRGQGLTVGPLSADGMFLKASGTVAQVEHAFNVTIAGYRAAGRSFYANTTAPTVPSAISGDLSQIVGLDDVAYAVPNYVDDHTIKASASRTASAKAPAKASTSLKSAYTVNSCQAIADFFSAYNSANGTDFQNGDGYYTDDALSNIYGLSPLMTSGDNGSGATVAVFELEDYDAAGVNDLNACYGHSTPVSEIAVDGGPHAPANQYTQVGMESALDIETISNLAPGAQVLDYAGPDADQASETDILNVWETIFDQDLAQVVSTSWGMCEPLTQTTSSTAQAAENALFEQAAVQGQTVVAASGDQGSTACFGEGKPAENSVLAVQDPASQPFVTAVGGTGMTGLSNVTPSVWNSNDAAPGGGVSAYWPLPSYQSATAAKGPGYTANCTRTGGCRQVPDVSALADPNDGYVIYENFDDGTDPAAEAYNIIAGTSGAAPVWAAVLALADATSSCQSNGDAGFINPNLYAAGEGSSHTSTFTDVTSGNNGIADFDPPYSYAAATGYDMASGWGTPNAQGVASTVCAGNDVSPASYYIPDGPYRLADTRPDATHHVGPVTGPINAYQTITLPVTGGTGAVPTSHLSAVVLNVTAIAPTAAGNAIVYPDGSTRPLASNLNWSVNDTIPNLVVVPVTNGKIDIYNSSPGTLNYAVDLEGYFTTDSTVTGASTYTAFGPARVADTRSNHHVGSVTGPLAGDSTTAIQIAGQQNLPASGMSAVVMNVTVTQPTSSGNLIVWPAGKTQPTSSNINYVANQTIPNLVVTPLSSDGKIDIYNNSGGTVQYIVDVEGYFSPGTSGSKYHPLGPTRLLDTRDGQGVESPGPIAKYSSLTLPLPAPYTAIIANLTVTAPTSDGDLDAYPAGNALPTISNVNFNPGETIPNLAFIPSNGGVSLYNHSAGTTQALLDLAGYFSTT